MSCAEDLFRARRKTSWTRSRNLDFHRPNTSLVRSAGSGLQGINPKAAPLPLTLNLWEYILSPTPPRRNELPGKMRGSVRNSQPGAKILGAFMAGAVPSWLRARSAETFPKRGLDLGGSPSSDSWMCPNIGNMELVSKRWLRNPREHGGVERAFYLFVYLFIFYFILFHFIYLAP